MATIIDQFDEILKCGICLEQLYTPKTLNCHHTFCTTCLENMFILNSEVICPTCRKKHANILKLSDVELLPTNLYVSQSLDILNKDGKKRSNPPSVYNVNTENEGVPVDNKCNKADVKCSTTVNLPGKDILKGMDSMKLSDTSSKDTCYDSSSAADEFFMYSDESHIPQHSTHVKKKKKKHSKILKYLNEKLYGEVNDENEQDFGLPVYNFKNYRTTKKDVLNSDQAISPANASHPSTKSSNKKGPFMLTTNGSNVGLLATGKKHRFVPKTYGQHLHGVGYAYKKRNYRDSSSTKQIPSTKKVSTESTINCSPFATTQAMRHHACGRGKRSGVIILLK